MIASCLILPTERPPLLIEVKRALLTYDHVHLLSADDRDVIQPEHYFALLSGVPVTPRIPGMRVRLLGKVAGYDDSFHRLLDDLAPAVDQGIVQVARGPTPAPPGVFSFGTPPTQADAFIYSTYRALATNARWLEIVSRGRIDDLLMVARQSESTLAPQGLDDGNVKVGVAQVPLASTAQYPGYVAAEDDRPIMTRLCLARLASAIKSLTLCAGQNLSPATSDTAIAALIQALNQRPAQVVAESGTVDERALALARLAELHDLLLAEFMDPTALNAMSASELIKLRTKAWGRAREHRTALANTLRRIAVEVPDLTQFRTACRHELRRYQETRADWDHEVRTLGVGAAFDLATLAATGHVISTVLDKMMTVGMIGTLLSLAPIGLPVLKDNVEKVLDLLHSQQKLEDLPGYALTQPYRPFL